MPQGEIYPDPQKKKNFQLGRPYATLFREIYRFIDLIYTLTHSSHTYHLNVPQYVWISCLNYKKQIPTTEFNRSNK